MNAAEKQALIESLFNDLRMKAANVTDGLLTELFEGKSPFRVMCMKCQTTAVDIIGEPGYAGSEFTGHCSGSLTLKCRECGSAESCNGVF